MSRHTRAICRAVLSALSAVAGMSGCASRRSEAPVPASDAPITAFLRPGTGDLRIPTLAEPASDVAVLSRRPTGDTVPHLVSHIGIASRLSSGDRGIVTLTRTWSPPFSSTDTLTVEQRTLRPIDEVLVFNRVRRAYHYDGARVTGTIQFPDSAPQAFDHTYDTPVFAFSEVDPLVRSLAYRAGWRAVVPLFSEVDHDVEHDTLTVTDRTRINGADVWIVTFADPVITTRYVVDARTRAIVSAVTTNRTSRAELRYQYR